MWRLRLEREAEVRNQSPQLRRVCCSACGPFADKNLVLMSGIRWIVRADHRERENPQGTSPDQGAEPPLSRYRLLPRARMRARHFPCEDLKSDFIIAGVF